MAPGANRVNARGVPPVDEGRPGELDRPVVVSPHLDDAALSCAYFLLAHPRTLVVTVFAASPPERADTLNAWDRACGFQPGADVMAVRRAEDRAALEVLGAAWTWLDFCQHSYVPRSHAGRAVPDGASEALEAAVRAHDPTAVLIPLGLAHPDHDVTHRLGRTLRRRMPELAWYCYAEKPYEHIPGALSQRIVELRRDRVIATPVPLTVVTDPETKWRAVREYSSQVGALDANWELKQRLDRSPETFWRLESVPRPRVGAHVLARMHQAVAGAKRRLSS